MPSITVRKKGVSKKIKLNRYAGKWVAFVDGKIVAVADTLDELEVKVKKLDLKKQAVYFLVPRKDEGPYILLIKSDKNEERI